MSDYLQIYDSNHAMDVTAWKLYLAEQAAMGQPVAFLADCDRTLQLTPQQVSLFLGTNSVWNDIGLTELTYITPNKRHTLLSGRKYFTNINGTKSIVNGSGQEIIAVTGRDNVTDLTKMFGSEIANYIYELGSVNGVAKLNSWGYFIKDHYEYNFSLQSVNVSAHITRDANNNIIGNYSLDSTKEFRGIFKLDANNNLYADGDVYEPSGGVTRNFGIRAYQSGDESLADAITDGTNTVYKLSTPTTETADPFTAIQDVSPYGTEEYVDYGVSQGTRDIAVPVGHKTTYAEVYSVDDVDYTYAYVSPTEDEEDATEYAMNLLGPRYGGSVEYVSGKISLTHDYHYVSYSDNANWTLVNQGNAQIVYADYSSIMEGIKTSGGGQQTALFDKFENSPIVKVGGANISNGTLSLCFASGRFDSVDDFKEWLKATNIFVVYELATPEIVQQYGTEVEILDGTNYVWSANGDVTVEYGLVPGILINPTLFDAKPVLEVVGDGDIYIGEQNIEIADISYGELELISAEALDTGYEPFNETNYELLNAGDEIRVKAGTSIPVGIAADNGVELNSLSLIISSTSGMTAHFESARTSYGHIYLPFVIDQDVVFHKGVESEAWAYLSVGISYRKNGQGYNYNGTAYFRIRLTNSPRYGWGMTITPLDNLTLPDELVRYFPSAQYVRKPVMGISTRSIIENPMIIDCDMGEAYTTDPNGNIVSLNSYIDLGSELPVLKPGITEITKDNTITDLKIKPRWWKI